jgi:methylaspartate ammonia-lyase
MRIVDVLAVPVQAGFFFDDQLAIRAGAGHDGFDYTGEPLIPGFRRVRQPGEAVSVLLLLDDGGVEFGDCAAVQYSGAGGRDPLFTALDAVAAVEKAVAPVLRGTDLGEGLAAVSARVDALTGPDASLLHTAVRYGVSQADAGLAAHCGGTCNETDRSAQVTAHVAMACQATQVLAKPGMGVDEGLMIVGNEMARTAALVRAREAL